MSSESQELKLGPGWTSLSKNSVSHPSASSPPPTPSASTSAPRLSYSKAQLLDLYEPHSTAVIPSTMAEYSGLTSTEPLVPVNIAPDDTLAHVSSLADAPDPSTSRTARLQPSAPRPGVEAILGRDGPHHSQDATTSSGTAFKKPGHVSHSSRNFWSESAVLAAAERPSTAASERRPLTLKPRSTPTARAASPTNHPGERTGSSHPYWSRGGAPRGTADSKANWRGGTGNAVASGGAKYPGSSADELTAGSSIGTHSSTTARKSTSDLMNTFNTGRPGFTREPGMFSRNHKEALKPTNTRDLSALAKGSNREQNSSYSYHHDREPRESREPRTHGSTENTHRSQDMDEAVWFYRDPQGATQGPFAANQLIAWEKEGYYDAELPVSKNAGHGFKPMAIAFGMRKEEAPTAAAPPGFVSSPTKNDTRGGPVGPSNTSVSRGDQEKHGGRSVRELAEEVEMMRLQARNKRAEEKAAAEAAAGDNGKLKKSFFDDNSEAPANGHGNIQNVVHDDRAKDLLEVGGSRDKHSGDHTNHDNEALSGSKPEEPKHELSKQSRFAALMKRSDDTGTKSTVITDVVSSPLPTSSMALSHNPQAPQSVKEFANAAERDPIYNDKAIVPPTERAHPKQREEDTNPWSTMMMGIQQNPGDQVLQGQQKQTLPHAKSHFSNGTIPSVPVTAADQELMAIDPAIAHASFAQPPADPVTSSAAPSGNAPELPAWLQLSSAATTGLQSRSLLHHVDGPQDPNLHLHQVLQNQVGMQLSSHDQARLQARLQAEALAHAERAQAERAEAERIQAERVRAERVQAEVHARAEAMRQAQVNAQMHAHVDARQLQAEARVAHHANVMPLPQSSHTPTRDAWLYKTQLATLRHNFEIHYNRLADMTRASRQAQATLTSAAPGTQEYENAKHILSRVQAAGAETAIQMDRIKRAADATNHLLLQTQTGNYQNLPYPGVNSSQPLPSPRGSSSPHGDVQSEMQPPKQEGNEVALPPPVQPIVSEAQRMVPMNGLDVGGVERMHEDQDKIRRDIANAYEASIANDQKGWETVGRKGSSVAGNDPLKSDDNAESTLKRVPSGTVRPSAEEPSAIAPIAQRSVPEVPQSDVEIKTPQVHSGVPRDPVLEQNKSTRPPADPTPTVAPWSKVTSKQTAGNGLSLREIQRQEELRNKAEERNAAAQQEKEESTKPPANRWNSSHAWGGAGELAKQQTPSLKEHMLEEEQRKKAAQQQAREAPSVGHGTSGVGTTARLGTKTGWASLVAKNTKVPQVRRATASVAGKRMEEETPFWESVSGHSHVSAGNVRSTRQNFAQAAAQVPTGAAQVRQPITKHTPAVTSTRRTTSTNKAAKSEAKDPSQSSESTDLNGRMSNELISWCTENMQKITGIAGQEDFLCQYLVTLKSPADIRDTVLQNLGSNDKTRSFADEFIRRLEFERNSTVADSSTSGTGGRKKGRRHRAAKVDPSLVLGFTSTSSRIMQGTIETPEMK